jgi:hypothetical protein
MGPKPDLRVKSWRASMVRTVAVFERMTIECVVAPPLNRRTPRSIEPSVTPVAANITSPLARSR